MGLRAVTEKRLSDRTKLSGLLPGRLTIDKLKPNINCRAIDVSKHGLGVLVQAVVSEGMKAKLECTLKGKVVVVELMIVWVKRDFGKQDLYRAGLNALDPAVDLEQIFLETGCIKGPR